MTDPLEQIAQVELTPRKREVLEEALQLLLRGGGKALTTAGIAKAANCSKESLYKWFGDRDGLLAAMMAYQGSKVRAGFGDETLASREGFENYLVGFGVNLLTVLSGELSLALNRLAIGQASDDTSPLGALLIKNGRGAVAAKGIKFLNAAREKGYLNFEDATEAYHVLYGLIVRDSHVRFLLGEVDPNLDIEAQSRLAVRQFYKLYGP